MKLTQSVIDRTKTPESKTDGSTTDVFVRCTYTPGFGLRIYSSGARSFFVEKRIHGKVRRKVIGKVGTLSVESARLIAIKHLTLIAEKKDPLAISIAEKVKRTTLKEAFSDFLLARSNLSDSTIKDYHRIIEGDLKDWLDLPLLSISRDMVEKRHQALGKRSHARANNAMRVFRALFNFARGKYEDENGHPVFHHNPVDRINHNRGWYKVAPRRGHIKIHQLNAWYNATQQLSFETTRDYLHFLLLTGLRRSEGQTLTWANIDFQDKTFTIPKTKNHRPHTLPFSSYIETLLTARYKTRLCSTYVFPSDSKAGYLVEPKGAIKTVIRHSNIQFSLHDLRRSFITIADSLDISAYAMKSLLNHKNPNDVTERYIITEVQRLREPMQRICDVIIEGFGSDEYKQRTQYGKD